MKASGMNDVPEFRKERLLRRRARRWKRRARMAGPFLAIPLLLGALMLSVNMIEYDPQPERHRLSDRPVAVVEKQQERPIHPKASAQSSSVASPTPAERDSALDVSLAGDTPLVGGPQFAAPMPHYTLPGVR